MNEFAKDTQSCWGVAFRASVLMAAMLFLAWLMRNEDTRPTQPEPPVTAGIQHEG